MSDVKDAPDGGASVPEGVFVPAEDLGGRPITEVRLAPRKAAEVWAQDKGYTPQFKPGSRGRSVINKQFWVWRAASVGWVPGKEMTEAEFDAAMDAAR